MKLGKKFFILGLAIILTLSFTACGRNETRDADGEAETDLTKEEGDTEDDDTKDSDATEDDETGSVTIDKLTLGEDYTDLEADIKFLTHRTDIVDTVFAGYIADFQKLYPGINIEYESITDYADDATIRLTTDNWGDICMIPTTIDKDELPNQFVSFGDQATLEKDYIMLNNFAYENQIYGIPSTGNAQGVVYNKKVFADAGITEIPKTPEEFLTALETIKNNTEAIPLYTNFAAEWTMSAWDAYIGGSATGDPDFMNNGLVHGKEPFSSRGDMTGPHAVYYVLYEAVSRGLIEDDPTTTDWEGSKGMINNGDIATMVLGSWAVVQMQEAGENSDDIGYMPFPITVDGKQYASAGPDYNYGINVNSSDDNKIASMLYIKWLTEESNFAYDQGGVPIQVGAEYPAVLDAFEGVELVIDNPAVEGEETYFNDVNNESELSLNADHYHVSQIVENAMNATMNLEDILNDWNERWAAAQEKFDIEVYE